MEPPTRKPRRRWIRAAAGLLLVVFGAFCLNYTRASSREHHEEWAAEHGLPGPGAGIRYAGMAAIAADALLAASALRRRA